MAHNYKIRNMLKNLPFYNEEIKSLKQKELKKLLMLEFYLNYHSFLKKLKKLTNCQLKRASIFSRKI